MTPNTTIATSHALLKRINTNSFCIFYDELMNFAKTRFYYAIAMTKLVCIRNRIIDTDYK